MNDANILLLQCIIKKYANKVNNIVNMAAYKRYFINLIFSILVCSADHFLFALKNKNIKNKASGKLATTNTHGVPNFNTSIAAII